MDNIGRLASHLYFSVFCVFHAALFSVFSDIFCFLYFCDFYLKDLGDPIFLVIPVITFPTLEFRIIGG